MLVKLGHNKGDKIASLGRFPPKKFVQYPRHFEVENERDIEG
jgi:hypothetical protein